MAKSYPGQGAQTELPYDHIARDAGLQDNPRANRIANAGIGVVQVPCLEPIKSLKLRPQPCTLHPHQTTPSLPCETATGVSCVQLHHQLRYRMLRRRANPLGGITSHASVLKGAWTPCKLGVVASQPKWDNMPALFTAEDAVRIGSVRKWVYCFTQC